jgi:hypothetical protein
MKRRGEREHLQPARREPLDDGAELRRDDECFVDLTSRVDRSVASSASAPLTRGGPCRWAPFAHIAPFTR